MSINLSILLSLMMIVTLVCLSGLVLSFYATHWYIYSSESFFDNPDERKSSRRPVASGGGSAFFLVFSLGMVVFAALDIVESKEMALVFVGGALVLLGRVDDRWGLSAKLRLLTHIVISVACSVHLLSPSPIVLPMVTIESTLAQLVFMTLLIGWFINLFNFMDGCDGLVGSVCALSALFLGFVCLGRGDLGHAAIYLLLAAVLLGFLRFNWERAKVFMGDSGSCFLGFIFAYLSFSTAEQGSLPLVFHAVVLGQFIFDPTYTMVFRLARRKTIFRPHREFAFHQVMLRGASHRQVCYYHLATSLLFLCPLAYLGLMKLLTWWVIMGIVFFALLSYQLYFTLYKGIKEA